MLTHGGWVNFTCLSSAREQSSTTAACSSNATAVGGSVATVTGTCPAGSYGSTTCTAWCAWWFLVA